MTPSERGSLRIVEDGRRFRVVFADETLADSVAARLLCEAGLHPVIYFPPDDVRQDALIASAKRSSCPFKGEARYWSVALAGRRAEDSVWSYPTPKAGAERLAGYQAFAWRAMESFWEEEQQLLAHPRNPFVRIDTLASRRRIQVRGGGKVLADSRAGVLLLETDLPLRCYLPRADVDLASLIASETRSVCPYKGVAEYFSLRTERGITADIAWSYPTPFVEVAAIKDHICFYPERVDTIALAAS
ncbi:MAG: DUF427 domain-containing protein [Rhodospirillales bacterium]